MMRFPYFSQPLFFIVALMGLSAANLFAYQHILSHEFLRWDDQIFLLNNPHIRTLSLENLGWMWREIHLDHWHPLTWLSFAVTYAGAGLDSGAFHRVNLILHSANTVWFFVVGALLYSLARHGNFSGLRQLSAWGVGFCAALLFAVHPQHVEIVAWASARKDLLCIFFLLPAFIAYLYYARSERWYWYGLSLLCFALALTAKTIAVTFPALLLVLDFYPLRRPLTRRLVLEKIPFFLLILVPLTLTVIGQQQASVMTDLNTLSLSARFLNAANSVMFYLSKWFVPLYLSPYYPFESKSLGLALLPVLGVFAVTLLTLALWFKKQGLWLSAWAFYLITLSPVIGIIQVGPQAAADRYTYLSTLPFYLLVSAAVLFVYQRYARVGRIMVISAVLVGVLILGLLTRVQTQIWRDSLSLWRYAVAYAPDSSVPQRNLATEYMFRGDYEKALTHYYFAMNLTPGVMIDYSNSAIAYIYTGQFDKALEMYDYIIENKLPVTPAELAQIYASMTWIYLRQNQPESARAALQQALSLEPAHAFAQDLWQRLEHNTNPSTHP
jgi:protein O-mannosyl-transferase